MPKPWENAEGYHDPTAYHGTKNIIRDEDEQQKRVNTLIFVLKYITRLAGFELLNRIEIKDRKTGREYRWKRFIPFYFRNMILVLCGSVMQCYSRVRYHLNFAGVGWCLCHSSLHWLFREMLKAGTEFANQYSSIGVGTAAFNICGMMLKALKLLQYLDFMWNPSTFNIQQITSII